MSVSLKKLWNDYGIGAIIVLFIIAYGVSLLAKYLSSKGTYGYENNQNMQQQYKKNPQVASKGSGNGVRAAEPLGQNEVFASANGTQTSIPGLPQS
jgi:hypothetical protein